MASMRRAPSRRSFTHLRRAVFGVAALIGLAAATNASAQFAYGYARIYPGPGYDDDLSLMPPRAVVYRLQDRGFTEIARPRFDGRAYVVDATNPAGNRVRLFVDAREGGVIGRQRLDTPYYPPGRVARAAPGYGWTEEDVAPRRANRDAQGLLPPGDIPLPRPKLHSEIDRVPALPSRPGAADPNRFGINPDARGGGRADTTKGDKARTATTPRKSAKLAPPTKAPAPRTAPEAPAPQTAPTEQAGPAPDNAKAATIEPPKAEPAPLTPAANQPVVSEKPAETPAQPQPTENTASEKPGDKPADEKRAEEKPAAEQAPPPKETANQGWQDPPDSDSKRNVRVIGGAIVVPGDGGEAPPTGTTN